MNTHTTSYGMGIHRLDKTDTFKHFAAYVSSICVHTYDVMQQGLLLLSNERENCFNSCTVTTLTLTM